VPRNPLISFSISTPSQYAVSSTNHNTSHDGNFSCPPYLLPSLPPSLPLAPNIFLRYSHVLCISCNMLTRSVWELGKMAALLQTAQQLYPAASHSVSVLYRVVSGEWRVFSGLSVFVNAQTNMHIEIRVENFQLEQILSEIHQLNTLSLLFNLYSALRMLNSAHFLPLWPCIVCHYRRLRSPTRPPLATINQPFTNLCTSRAPTMLLPSSG